MTKEENIRAILECNFTETKEELIDIAVKNIMALEQEPCDECRNKHTSFCGNCKEYDEFEPCDDAISREDALKLIYDFKEKHTEDREKHPINYGTLLDLIRLIRELPSVTHKSGKWIDREVYDADRWKCSACGRTEPYREDYCPNCGAKMESEDNG